MRGNRAARKRAKAIASHHEEESGLPYHIVESELMESDEFVHAVEAMNHAMHAGDALRCRGVDIDDERREQLSRAEVAASDALSTIVDDILTELRTDLEDDENIQVGGEAA